jgi:MoaA/NifB/PqqE/SkfB family radical SAM enzyme
MCNKSSLNEIEEFLGRYLTPNSSEVFSYERFLANNKRKYLEAFIDRRPFPPFEVEIQMSSKCNLECSWCIGDEVQSDKKVLNLPNSIKKETISSVIDGIIKCKIGGLKIEAVKFSGFIGEPLILKNETLEAMQRLVGAGKEVGLFTNGVLMDPETWDTLVNIDYVHISLDAGPNTFYWLKESKKRPFGRDSFDKVIENIQGLNKARKREHDSKLKINVGYVVVPGNHEEVFEASRIVKKAGADSIRFKIDIGGKHDLIRGKALDRAFDEIEKAKQKLNEKGVFSVNSVHTKRDAEEKKYSSWKCVDGCDYQYFLATVGSDGNLYLCDHNTMPGGIPLGNVIDNPFTEVWESDRRDYLSKGVMYTCQCPVCPPFGNRINFFLKEIRTLTEIYGPEQVKAAIDKYS